MLMSIPHAIAVIFVPDEFDPSLHEGLEDIGVVQLWRGETCRMMGFAGARHRWVIVFVRRNANEMGQAIVTERAITYFDPDTVIFLERVLPVPKQDACVVWVFRNVDVEGNLGGSNEGLSGAFLDGIEREWRNRYSSFVQSSRQAKSMQAKLRFSQDGGGPRWSAVETPALWRASIGFLTAAAMNPGPCALAFAVTAPTDGVRHGHRANVGQAQLSAAAAFAFLVHKQPTRKFLESQAPSSTEILVCLRNRFVVEACPYEQDTHPPAELNFGAYADAGFFAEAVAAKISNRAPNEMDKAVLCEVATLCQKAGYVDMAWRFIHESLIEKNVALPGLKAHIYLVAMKLFSQQGDEEGAAWIIAHHGQILKWLRATGEQGKMPSVYTRTGVAYALLGQLDESAKCFSAATDLGDHANEHQRLTIRVLWAIANVFRSVPFPVGCTPIATVVEAQTEYLRHEVTPKFAQAYPLKSAVQALFAEAAMLMRSNDPQAGYLRLAAAGVMRRKAFAHPKAEGFAELLALIPDGSQKELLRFVMDPALDITRRPEVQAHLERCSRLTALFSFDAEHWAQLRALFKDATHAA